MASLVPVEVWASAADVNGLLHPSPKPVRLPIEDLCVLPVDVVTGTLYVLAYRLALAFVLAQAGG